MTDATEIARSECGDHGEDTLTVWKSPIGEITLERVAKDGTSRQWRVDPTDTLRVTGDAWGSGGAVGANMSLSLITSTGTETEVSHFEFSFAWGGPTDDLVADLARLIAHEAGCTVTVAPMTYPAHVAVAPAPPAPITQTTASPPLPPIRPVQDLTGATLLATLPCGDRNAEQLRAFQRDGTVVIENTTTGSTWLIAPDDVLVITPFAGPGGPWNVWTLLERSSEDRIAGFLYLHDDREGSDPDAVAAFAATVSAASGCTVNRREMVWD